MSDEKVTLVELLAEYGTEKLRFQVLSGSLDGQQTTREKDNTTRLSFRTEQSLRDVLHENVEAFIVWMDKPEMLAAMDRCKARRTSPVPSPVKASVKKSRQARNDA